MARDRSSNSFHDRRGPTGREPEGPDADRGLTPAEQHAMRRSAPLTPTQFKELRRLAERGVSPLRHL